MRGWGVGLLCGVLLGVLPSAVHAQGWLEDRERTEGPGFRLGDFELHPGIGAEMGYDSNVFYSDPDGNVEGSPILRITPHVYLSTLGDQRRGGDDDERRGSPPAVAFRGGLSASLYHYFETAAQSNIDGDLDLNLIINPERQFQLTLSESLGRRIRPFTEAGAVGDDYARIENRAGAQIDFGTRGQIFAGRLGYELGVDIFEGESFDYANNLQHRISAGTNWRFLPHTALVYEFDVTLLDYTDTAGALVLLSDQTLVSSRIGINGAVTQKLSLLAMVGYAAGYFDIGDEYGDIIGQLEARFQLTPAARWSLGYDRSFQQSFVGGFYRRDRVYTNLQFLLGRSFLVGIEGDVGTYDFGALLAPGATALADGLGSGGESNRDDIRVTASLFGEYRATDWLGFNATFSYTGDFTDFEYLRDAGGATIIDPADYQKFEVWGGVRVFY